MTDLMERLWSAIEDPQVQSVQLTLMNNPGRGEDVAYQAILRPVDASVQSCFSILRTPKAAIQRMLDQWDERRPDGPAAPDEVEVPEGLEDLI